MNDKTTKPETAAEVLAEMNRSADYGCRVTTLATRDWADRIERAHANELASLLPGPEYMDPPDGGDVTLLEQCRRMSEDAAKWRALSAQGEAVAEICFHDGHRYARLLAEENCSLPPGTELFTRPATASEVQGEAVGEVNIAPLVGVLWYENCGYGCDLPSGTKLYTHPAPARVTEETTREAVAEALRRWPDAEASILFMVGAIGPLGNITKSDIEWARAAALEADHG